MNIPAQSSLLKLQHNQGTPTTTKSASTPEPSHHHHATAAGRANSPAGAVAGSPSFIKEDQVEQQGAAHPSPLEKVRAFFHNLRVVNRRSSGGAQNEGEPAGQTTLREEELPVLQEKEKGGEVGTLATPTPNQAIMESLMQSLTGKNKSLRALEDIFPNLVSH